MENKVLYNAKAANKINAIFLAVITLVIAFLDVLCFIPLRKDLIQSDVLMVIILCITIRIMIIIIFMVMD